MTELFRFIALRAPQKANPTRSISLAVESPFQKALRRDLDGPAPRLAMLKRADAYTKSKDFVGTPAALRQARSIDRLRQALLAKRGDSSSRAITHRINEVFGATPREVIKKTSFQDEKARIFDSIIAIWMTPAVQRTAPIVELALAARLLNIVERSAAGDPELSGSRSIQEALQETLILPPGLFPLPTNTPAKKPRQAKPPKLRDFAKERSSLLTRLHDSRAAISTLAKLASSAYLSPKPIARQSDTARQAGATHELRTQARDQLRLAKHAIDNLPPSVKKHLLSEGLDPAQMSVPAIQSQLVGIVQDTTQRVRSLPIAQPAARMVRVGNDLRPVTTLFDPPGGGSASPSGGGSLSPSAPSSPPAVAAVWTPPGTKGSLTNVGVGSLLVVRQHILRYDRDEISYVENVLKTESRRRTTVHTTTTEQSSTTETETTKETETDLQSADHFDLKREIDSSLKEDLSVKAGLAISAKYGTVLEVNSNLDVGFEQSKEEASKQAQEYSKDVTSRAATKLTQRVLQTQTLRTVESFQDTNRHGFDNTKGKSNVVGIYQWLTKVYQAQVFDYGSRTMFDMMVPEPAAFWIDALKNRTAGGPALTPPDPFNITPDDIDETNYNFYIQKWTATGVTPPPAEFVTVAHAWADTGDKKPEDEVNKAYLDFKIPTDYEAYDGTAVIVATPKSDAELPSQIVNVVVGKTPLVSNALYVYAAPISPASELEIFPVTAQSQHAYDVAVSVEVICHWTDGAKATWQLATYNQLLAAYTRLQADYEQKLQAEQDRLKQETLTGTNPSLNTIVVTTELRKHCISLLTGQHFETFGAVDEGAATALLPLLYPEPNLTNAGTQGKYIRFFEQAFEWDQMMYFFYPYYWGRKADWYNQATLDDADKAFGDFLRAGAARVVVSVRRGFEQAVQHFLDTGETWNGGDLPMMGSDLYLSIIEEIKQATGAPGKEKPASGDAGKPWEIRVPTELLLLRTDGKLPTWTQDKTDPTKWTAN